MKNDWEMDLDVFDLDDLMTDEPEEADEAEKPQEPSDKHDNRRAAASEGSQGHHPARAEGPSGRPQRHSSRPTAASRASSGAYTSHEDESPEDDFPEGIVYDTATLPPEFIGDEDDYFSEDVTDSYFAEEESYGKRGRSGESRRGTRASARQGRGGRSQAPERTRRDDDGEYENRGGSRRGIPIHLILPVVILFVLVVAVVRLLIWNQGTTIDTTTSENSFNVEVNDSMVIVSSSDLEGAADDGVTTILCLGNEPFSADTSDAGLAGQIAALGDAAVINAAFPDSQVTCENATYTVDSLDSMDDIFNLFYVAYAISIDDYSSLATVASAHSDETYASAVEALESTDFTAVDIIAIQYDGIDYINGMAMYNEDVPTELTTYVGSLTNSFTLLREAYPHIRIVFMSPWYAEYDGASSRTTDLGNGTIVDYFQWAYDTCGSDGISFLDNYYGSINENNFEEYLSDGVNLNADGCTKIADHFVYKVIQGNYAEYNVEQMAVAE